MSARSRPSSSHTSSRSSAARENRAAGSETNINSKSSRPQEGRTGVGNMLAQAQMVAKLALALALVALLFTTIECHYAKRTQYHEQGVHGPKSYKFGFTGGDYKNPQERHEVSDGYGHVKGWYSFVDAYGKHQVVHYEAHPKYGFKVINHSSKALNNGKRHYNS